MYLFVSLGGVELVREWASRWDGWDSGKQEIKGNEEVLQDILRSLCSLA